MNRGNDSGLAHSWTDRNVYNDATYWYSVTTYDRGIVEEDTANNPDGWASLNSFECDRGVSPWFKFVPEGPERLQGATNLVMVIPGPRPPDWEDPVVPEVPEPLPGTVGNGSIGFEVIDPYAVTGHTYIVSFDDSTQPGTLMFDVFDESTEQYVLRSRDEINTPSTVIPAEGPIFDGLKINITNWDEVAFWADSSYLILGEQTDSTNMDFFMTPFVSRAADYELIFTEAGDTSFNDVVTPFEIWNTTENVKPRFDVQEDFSTQDKVWQDGEPVRLWEGTLPTWTIHLFARPDTLSVDSIEVTCCPPETIYYYTFGDTFPLHTGDEIIIKTKKPFVGGDRFALQTVSMTTGVEEEGLEQGIPESYYLGQNYPNPFNPTTSIQYSVIGEHSPLRVTLKIHNILGQEVRTLVDEPKGAGYYAVTWDGRDSYGNNVASGIYFYQLKAGDFVTTKRMVLIR
ncbi:MAG: FlgD immunoglobulin-like domain containing protein [bacterium]